MRRLSDAEIRALAGAVRVRRSGETFTVQLLKLDDTYGDKFTVTVGCERDQLRLSCVLDGSDTQYTSALLDRDAAVRLHAALTRYITRTT